MLLAIPLRDCFDIDRKAHVMEHREPVDIRWVERDDYVAVPTFRVIRVGGVEKVFIQWYGACQARDISKEQILYPYGMSISAKEWQRVGPDHYSIVSVGPVSQIPEENVRESATNTLVPKGEDPRTVWTVWSVTPEPVVTPENPGKLCSLLSSYKHTLVEPELGIVGLRAFSNIHILHLASRKAVFQYHLLKHTKYSYKN